MCARHKAPCLNNLIIALGYVNTQENHRCEMGISHINVNLDAKIPCSRDVKGDILLT
jgi:hypothetical protein